jgi:hypothetical protein
MRPWALILGVGLVAAVSWRLLTDSASSGTTEATLCDPDATANETAQRALTTRGLRNEIAFARLLGYVRYFHPSDEAAAADWEALAIRGAAWVEGRLTITAVDASAGVSIGDTVLKRC